MTREEAQLILSCYRPETGDADDPVFAEALKLASEDRELGEWFAEDRKRDVWIAENWDLQAGEPFGMKTALLAARKASPSVESSRLRVFALIAATALATFLLTWGWMKNRAPEPGLLEQFRGEMISFVKLDPLLELESDSKNEITVWLQNSGKPDKLVFPPSAPDLPLLGCRLLKFRGQPVILICFQRKDGKLIHLLAVDAALFPGIPESGKAEIVREGDWITSSWRKEGRLFMLATQGEADQLRTPG